MTSIIIPAHNEENVIERCLRQFIKAVEDNEFEVIVVCNGCTDQTAQITTNLSDKFICVATETASKTHALNIGDEIASTFPRIYLDADVLLPTDAIAALCDTLDKGHLVASTEVKMDLSGSTWPVKAYYDVWFTLPYIKIGMMGAGLYALSERGRKRFGKFPDLIADDGYVRCLFKDHERGVTYGYYSVVTAPKNITGLIKIKTRSRLGYYQLKEEFPELIKKDAKDYKATIKQLLTDIRSWPKIFVYLVIYFITKIRVYQQIRKNIFTWERDDSSRSKSQI
jgi:glycosyltransferase involved in cell wall biosynthesis